MKCLQFILPLTLFFLCNAAAENTYGNLEFKTLYSSPDYLEFANNIYMSPQGSIVFASSHYTETLCWYARDIVSGTLLFIGKLYLGEGGHTASVAATKDGSNIYIATEDTLQLFSMDYTSWQLKPLGEPVKTDFYTSEILLAKDDRVLYMFTFEKLAWLKRNPLTGAVTFLGQYEHENENRGHWIEAVAIPPDERYLYVLFSDNNFRGQDSIFVFNINQNDGSLTKYKNYPEINIPQVSDFVISPDGKHMYITSLLSKKIHCYNINPTTGELAFNFELTEDPDLKHTLSIVTSHDGKNIYVSTGNCVVSYQRDSITGSLVKIGVYNDPGRETIKHKIIISPDDKHVYTVVSQGKGIEFFERNMK